MKSAKTYEEQVELIKDKGFIIENDSNCIHFLKTANYYRLSAYYLPFRNNDNSFISGISFYKDTAHI